jgi:hypothetical protein
LGSTAPYAGAAGMLLHINGKFTMEKLVFNVSFFFASSQK